MGRAISGDLGSILCEKFSGTHFLAPTKGDAQLRKSSYNSQFTHCPRFWVHHCSRGMLYFHITLVEGPSFTGLPWKQILALPMGCATSLFNPFANNSCYATDKVHLIIQQNVQWLTWLVSTSVPLTSRYSAEGSSVLGSGANSNGAERGVAVGDTGGGLSSTGGGVGGGVSGGLLESK